MKSILSKFKNAHIKSELTPEDVVAGFRLILGRAPESEEAIQAHLSLGCIENLGKALMSSQEFSSKYLQAQFSESKWVTTQVLDRYLMWVDLHDRYVSHGCLNDNWEPEETAFFISRLHAGDTVLDIGANIGWFSLVAAKHIGPTGVIHAFEPRPVTYSMLAKTIALNGLRDLVHLWEYALSDEAGDLMINWAANTDNPGNSFVTKDKTGPAGHESARVRAVRLDELLPDIAPDVIKIDVEGAEPMVFAGAVNALKRRRPIILSELFPDQLMKVSGKTPVQYIQQMEEYGYACYLLEGGKPTRRLKDFLQGAAGKELVSVVFEWRGA
jgi:FkbM family methyltransferase